VKKLAIILGALALFVVQPVAGQDFPVLPTGEHEIQYTGHSNVTGNYGWQGSYYVGTYFGNWVGPSNPGGGSAFTMYCVDFNGRLSQNQTFSVNGIHVGDYVAPSVSFNGWTPNYIYAAYLASLFSPDNMNHWSAIHAAIWYFTDGVTLTDSRWAKDPDTYSSRADYVRLAEQSNFDGGNWHLLIPENWTRELRGPQMVLVRFSAPEPEPSVTVISTVPEPGVIVLLLSGLLGVAFVARRRSAQLS
jgi:hypothetical protein